jgi:hypothetical protein
VLVLLIAGSAGTVATAAAHAADVLLHIVLITVASLAGLSLSGLGAWLVISRRRARRPAPWQVSVQPPAAKPVSARSEPRQALTAPQIHLHLHGPVSATDVAELIARQATRNPPSEPSGAVIMRPPSGPRNALAYLLAP